MSMRHGGVFLVLLCLSCHAVTSGEPDVQAEPAPQPTPQPAPPAVPGQLWQLGQAAMHRGEPDTAIALYEQSLAADPQLTRNHLSLAAAHLEKGNLGGASVHLALYVEAHPEKLIIRARYAELLLRLHRLPEARAEFERFVADAQDEDGPAAEHILHCHSRLMQIAEDSADHYGEHLHRGIGMYLLAREREKLPDADGELPAEGLLFKAAAELTLARLECGDEARASWYLYEVWRCLGQQRPARRWLRETAAAAPFAYLTPAEQRGLDMARQALEDETRR
jgi:tetratricopeptide (TPR) repeat protein